MARAINNVVDPFDDIDATLSRVYAVLRTGEPYPRLSEREQVELLDELEPANRRALLHAVSLMRSEGLLSEERIDEIAKLHRADGWTLLCGLGYCPPWGKLPAQQRVALQLAGSVLADLRARPEQR